MKTSDFDISSSKGYYEVDTETERNHVSYPGCKYSAGLHLDFHLNYHLDFHLKFT